MAQMKFGRNQVHHQTNCFLPVLAHKNQNPDRRTDNFVTCSGSSFSIISLGGGNPGPRQFWYVLHATKHWVRLVSGDQQLRRRHGRCVDGSRFHLGKSRERIAGTDDLNVLVRIHAGLFQHLSREQISGAAAQRIDSEDFSTGVDRCSVCWV